MALILGIDEAGRGPVIGPLVIAGALIEENKLTNLKEIGVKDSKLLSPKKRREIANKLKRILKDYLILIIEPPEIDEAVDGKNKLNLNWLEAIKTVEVINKLKPDRAIIDCPSPNIRAYTEYIRERLKEDVELIVEHKADHKYLITGAASILAKESREEEVDKIRKKYGNIGPGYMSNPITQKFLEENWEKHPEIFRRSWMSWKNHKRAKNQKRLGEF